MFLIESKIVKKMSMVVFSTSEKGKGLASDHAGLENGNILH